MIREKQSKWKKFILPLVIIFLFLGGIAWFQNARKTDKPLQKVNAKNTYEKYFVPVTNYTNTSANLAFKELKTYDLVVENGEESRVREMLGSDFTGKLLVAGNPVDAVINDKSKIALVPFDQVDHRVKTLSVDGKLIWDKNISDYPLKIKVKAEDDVNIFNPQKITVVTSTGDVILGRTVAKKMSEYNDWTHPWLKVADYLKKADITFVNLENSLSDRITPPYEGMSFVAPTKSIEGFTLAGVDIVALANNHSTNFGTEFFKDTLKTLVESDIKYVGGGNDLEEAESLKIIEKNGVSFGFLNYNSIVGAINAKNDRPGVVKLDIKPWFENSEADMRKVEESIKSADNKVDVLIVQFHWGIEYVPDPIEAQIVSAHRAVDAGADIIIGTHPHVVSGIESYKNVPIFYSLGNFIFDQEWSTETTQGVVVDTYFYEDKVVATPITTYQIYDYNQPAFVTGVVKNEILHRIFKASLSREYR